MHITDERGRVGSVPSVLDTSEIETFSTLVGRIYDAVLNPTTWPEVMRLCADFLPGHSAALFAKDASGRAGDLYHDDGRLAPYYKQSYFEKYVHLDPANTVHFFADVGTPVSTCDIMPYPEFVETRFYKEWVQPQAVVDFISVQLDRSATSAAMFGIFRHERHGLVDDETRWRMRLLAPHVQRAALISRSIDLKRLDAATLADTLDGISAAMFLVDAHAKVTHVNAAGHALLAEGDVLQVMLGRLRATDDSANRALTDIFASAGEGDKAVGTKGIAVPLTARDGTPYVAHVLALTSGARRKAGLEYSAAAAVFVRKAQLDAPRAPEIIAKRYALTPSELRVLLTVFEVGGVADIAEILGISEPTAKTHLRRLFDKTGTRRQSDLVRLVAGYAASQL